MLQKNVNTHIAFVGGKSGGHILPALTLAHQKRQKEGSFILFFSHNLPLDKAILQEAPWIDTHCTIPVLKFSSFYSIFNVAFKAQAAFVKCIFSLKKHKIREVISMGGALSVPVCLAAWALHIPFTLYELNAVPGKAVRFLARFAQRIYVCFPSAQASFTSCPDKVQEAPYPLRFSESDRLTKNEARTRLAIPLNARVLFVMGGSQGSEFLNSFAEGYIRHRMVNYGERESVIIFHQTGPSQREGVENFYRRLGVTAKVFSYQSAIQHYYASADLVITRAGAGTLFELAFFKARSLIIPLESTTTNHQLDNAYAMAQKYPEYLNVHRQADVERAPEEMYRYIDAIVNTI